ncbi:acyltransferase ChoActase/COT/CPT [Chiua virens]|nr:acyltransferase ChoActase/COT/CPT [Chiua virens]
MMTRRIFNPLSIRVRFTVRSMSHLRASDWKTFAPPIPNFAHQSSSLPSLPVPALSATLQRLKDSLRPLARSTQEFASVSNKIDDFARLDGPGPTLQQLLLKRKNETDHWLEEWWDDLAYLSYRDSVVVNVSYYYGFKPQPAHLPQTPAARAAGITRAAMLFRQNLRSGQLAPDANKDSQFCMDTYRWMFDCCRVPGAQGIDWSVSYAGSPNPHDDLGHVIVVRKNRFWKIKVQVGDKVAGMGDLISQFQYIYDHSSDEYPAIGVLTTNNRDVWAKDFTRLSSIPRNATLLREIHSAAFLVSLDDSTPAPECDVDVSRALWHGTLPSPSNPTGVARGLSSRFVDKPLQFVVFDNGVAGLMGEHSVMDGTPSVRLCDELLGFLADPKSDVQLSPSVSPAATPKPLDFDLTSIPDIHTAISNAQQFLHNLSSSQSLSFVRTNYGKDAIKSFGVGPDGWAQMTVQVAYARLAERFGGENGRVTPWPVGTYEAATTRKFYKGRTETIRVVSDECVAFVRAMLGQPATRSEKVQLFRDAVKKHTQLAQEAVLGEGVDRHMLGLRLSKPPSMSAPALFTDPLFTRSSHWTLSTSAVFSRHFGVYGWGEVVPDGFGVAYMTGFDDYLQFTITSRAELPNAEFAQEIRKATGDLYELFAGSVDSPASNMHDSHAKL